MASSSVDQTTQSQSVLTTSEAIKCLYPKEVYENWFKCYGNPDAHRPEDLSFQTQLLTHTERDIAKIKCRIENIGRVMLESSAQCKKMAEYWTKTTELAEESGFDGAEHVQEVHRLYQIAVEDHTRDSSRHSAICRRMQVVRRRLNRYKRNIDEINEKRRQLEVFGKHYLGRDD